MGGGDAAFALIHPEPPCSHPAVGSRALGCKTPAASAPWGRPVVTQRFVFQISGTRTPPLPSPTLEAPKGTFVSYSNESLRFLLAARRGGSAPRQGSAVAFPFARRISKSSASVQTQAEEEVSREVIRKMILGVGGSFT